MIHVLKMLDRKLVIDVIAGQSFSLSVHLLTSVICLFLLSNGLVSSDTGNIWLFSPLAHLCMHSNKFVNLFGLVLFCCHIQYCCILNLFLMIEFRNLCCDLSLKKNKKTKNQISDAGQSGLHLFNRSSATVLTGHCLWWKENHLFGFVFI